VPDDKRYENLYALYKKDCVHHYTPKAYNAYNQVSRRYPVYSHSNAERKIEKILRKHPLLGERMKKYLKVIGEYPPDREHLLAMLHDIQDVEEKHFLSREALLSVAEYLDMPISEVASTTSFYTMFSLAPRGKHIIRVCVSPPCQALGGSTILATLKELLGLGVGETTRDGLFTLETTSCLGVCGVAPAMMIDEDVYGKLTQEKIKGIIEYIRRKDAAH
jgi:NADH:ubiquinone oxidoreductase subunit E